MPIARMRLKVRTSNLTSTSPGRVQTWPLKKFSKRGHGQGHMNPRSCKFTWRIYALSERLLVYKSELADIFGRLFYRILFRLYKFNMLHVGPSLSSLSDSRSRVSIARTSDWSSSQPLCALLVKVLNDVVSNRILLSPILIYAIELMCYRSQSATTLLLLMLLPVFEKCLRLC